MEQNFFQRYKLLIIVSLCAFIAGGAITSLVFYLAGGKTGGTEIVSQVDTDASDSQESDEGTESKYPEKGIEIIQQNIDEEVPSVAKREDAQELDITSEFGIQLSDYHIKHSKVRKNQFFANLLTEYGVSQKTIYDLTQRCKGIFDMRKFKVGNAYEAYISKETGELDYLSYEQDSRSYAFFILKDTLDVKIMKKNFMTTRRYSEIKIENSLWMDVIASGASPLLAIKMADIYAWTIDFFGLQPGDSFKALYEEISYNGEVLDIGKVYYAEFTHLNEANYAYYFEEDENESGSNVYWNEKGESLRKAFLKAPLNFTRISSGFSYNRRHPVTRKVSPHTGVDYAAPIGTPVMSIGDGVVVSAGYKGPNGNMVKIKHNSVYTSAYLHLSRYGKGIKAGTRVKQGQIIGYVGNTGRSTGPHLDFRIWKNNSPINPLKMQSPPAKPIAPENKERFESAMKEALSMIDEVKVMEFWREAFEILEE